MSDLLATAPPTVDGAARPVLALAEHHRVIDALRCLRAHGQPLTVVFGAGGSTVGIVTLAALAAALVDDIYGDTDTGRC